MLIQSYHACGHPIQFETKAYGQKHHFTKFYDGRKCTSPQHVRNCPACQKPLGSINLLPHPAYFEKSIKSMA